MSGRWVVVALVLAGCGSHTTAAPATTTTAPIAPVSVRLTWHSAPGDRADVVRWNDDPNGPCGRPRFTRSTDKPDSWDFMLPGDPVLKDAHAAVIATGFVAEGRTSSLTPDNEFDCTWHVDFYAVPPSDFYTLSFGAKDVMTFSRAEITKDGVIKATLQK